MTKKPNLEPPPNDDLEARFDRALPQPAHTASAALAPINRAGVAHGISNPNAMCRRAPRGSSKVLFE